jgi:hypothetical protein
MSGRVTKLAACLGCGAELLQPATGRRPRYCGSACRQRAYRTRQSAERARQAKRRRQAAVEGRVLEARAGWFALSHEERERARRALSFEIARRRQEQRERQRRVDQDLFAGEVAA